MSHRLFVAIRPPEPIRERLLDTMEGIEGARWQDDEQLHLTLRFIGEVERPVANELAEAMARIDAPSFPIDVSGVGHFERKGRPHAVWARVEPSEGLERLRQKVERACAGVGLERDTRRFTPHITLARLGSGSGPVPPWLAAHGALRIDAFEADAFSLFESHLLQSGAHYEEVTRYRLGAASTTGPLQPKL